MIYRYNPDGQEAAAPFENRNASGYLLAFDDTQGTSTGVALNVVAAQPVKIPVVVRDDTGAQIATDSLSLAANGHLAFTLEADKYPVAADRRGTIEFTAPAGAQIGTLGIRIPIAHTFTTLPALWRSSYMGPPDQSLPLSEPNSGGVPQGSTRAARRHPPGPNWPYGVMNQTTR